MSIPFYICVQTSEIAPFFSPRFLVINWAENANLFIHYQSPLNIYSADKDKKAAEEPGYVTSYIFYITAWNGVSFIYYMPSN
jgi:hypothetical protein